MSVQQQLRGKPNEPPVVLEKLVDLLRKAALGQLFRGSPPDGQAISAGDNPELVPAEMSERMFGMENLGGGPKSRSGFFSGLSYVSSGRLQGALGAARRAIRLCRIRQVRRGRRMAIDAAFNPNRISVATATGRSHGPKKCLRK